MINWGKLSDDNAIVLSTSVITDAYNEIATWRKKVSLVPYGEVGRDLIDQVTLHIKGAVSRNTAKLENYKMPFNLREHKNNHLKH